MNMSSQQTTESLRRKSLAISGALHLFWLVIILIGLPSFFTRERIEEPQAITVELLPITGITNVKPTEKKTEAKEDKPEEKASPKEAPPVEKAEPAPAPEEKPAEKPEEKKPEEKKPEVKKEEKKKPKEDDLTAVLKAVRDTAQKQDKKSDKDKKSGEKNKAISNQYDPTLPMSLSEKDAIRSQIAKCWSVPAGAKDAQDLTVVLRIELQMDGSVLKVELASESKTRYSRDTFFRAAADSAMRAVRQCSPLQNLPPDKYSTWKDMELMFDPKEMLF